ncbi:alpha-acetolactate decarboxylase [Flavobacterium cyanobacteriorum]|uniref:Alpha-acetolactate decarboxylase n=2 Tax=Flavobacterium cyanobacteriorum TaxID=2022802 RepID=A0A256A1E5_9FLAO|nr:alpha-acetolactate decarboxylase [Flavobacterium cyanobacteriorum]
MKNVMWGGRLEGTIDLDTIADREHLYGLGPVEGLRGEVIVVDGKAYKSAVVSATAMTIEETFRIKAPFFVHAWVRQWKEYRLPATVKTMRSLEAYLDSLAANVDKPFVFRMAGIVNEASVHVVNLPEGATVSSPAEAHRGQVSYAASRKPAEIIGFFSRNHQSVFTHHDTYMHLHLITADKTLMGHLDSISFSPDTMKLFLPVN